MGGWIKIYRNIQEHWIWEDAQRFKWWIDLILMANHKDKKLLLGGELVVIKRGSFHTSELKLAERWDVDRKTVRRFLELLENDHMIYVNRTTKGTTIEVSNYKDYQGVFDDEKSNQRDNGRDSDRDNGNGKNADNNSLLSEAKNAEIGTTVKTSNINALEDVFDDEKDNSRDSVRDNGRDNERDSVRDTNKNLKNIRIKEIKEREKDTEDTSPPFSVKPLSENFRKEFTIIQNLYEQLIGPMDSNALDIFKVYLLDGIETTLLLEAIKIASTKVKTPQYIRGILRDWVRNDIRSLKQLQEKSIKRDTTQSQAHQKKTKFTNIASHDWDFDEIQRLEREYVQKKLKGLGGGGQ